MPEVEYEVLREIYRITERRGDATYATEYLRRDWVPMNTHGDGADLIYCVITEDIPFTQTIRRKAE